LILTYLFKIYSPGPRNSVYCLSHVYDADVDDDGYVDVGFEREGAYAFFVQADDDHTLRRQ